MGTLRRCHGVAIRRLLRALTLGNNPSRQGCCESDIRDPSHGNSIDPLYGSTSGTPVLNRIPSAANWLLFVSQYVDTVLKRLIPEDSNVSAPV